MPPGDVVTRTSAACKRCHDRKKKCDKAWPRCRACSDANTTCSFEHEHEESATFNVAYVRGLERKVQELERQLRQALQVTASYESNDRRPSPIHSQRSPYPVDHGNQTAPTRQASEGRNVPRQRSSTAQQMAFDLEMLSLQATADKPFLGPSSGVSFARLTQAVLRRLQPDQYSSASLEDLDPNGESPDVARSARQRYHVDSEVISNLPFPKREDAARLTEFYWRHSHTLYPFLHKRAFNEAIAHLYSKADAASSLTASWLYKIWMVLAIGSTTLSSIHVQEEEESIMYFHKAMTYFEAALMEGNMVALESLLLQVVYSFFNQLGPNTWHLVGAALRIAIGHGLHTKPQEQLPMDVVQRRLRTFWSLYMMDRVVSVALGRPFGIRDEDIDVEPFSDVDDHSISSDRIVPPQTGRVSQLAIPLHILRLRRIAGEILTQVYGNKRTGLCPSDRKAILSNIHDQLVTWRRNMPFPLRESEYLRVPHFTAAWFDLNYYNLVMMLYRPSPLCPVLGLEEVHLIADASAMALRQSSVMARQAKYSFNWLNLFQLFTITLTLMYAVTAQPDPLPEFLRRSDAINDLELAASLLEKFSAKFPTAVKCRNIVRHVIARLRRQVSGTDNSPGKPSQSSGDQATHPAYGDYSDTNVAPLGAGSPAGRVQVSPTPLGLVSTPNSTHPFLRTGNPQYDALVSQLWNEGSEGLHGYGPVSHRPSSSQDSSSRTMVFDAPSQDASSQHIGFDNYSQQLDDQFGMGSGNGSDDGWGALLSPSNALFSTPLQMMLAPEEQTGHANNLQSLLSGQSTMDLDIDLEGDGAARRF